MHDARNPEIEDFRFALFSNEHVGRLQVGVDNVAFVRVLQPVGNTLNDPLEAGVVADAMRVAVDEILQRLALQHLHVGVEHAGTGIGVAIVDRGNMRVGEFLDSRNFALQSDPGIRAGIEVAGQHFDRHVGVGVPRAHLHQVAGAKHLAHAAAAEFLAEFKALAQGVAAEHVDPAARRQSGVRGRFPERRSAG